VHIRRGPLGWGVFLILAGASPLAARPADHVGPRLHPPRSPLSDGAAIAGLAMLRRGLVGYRTADRIADTGTSSVSSLAAGEVRIADSGTVEPA